MQNMGVRTWGEREAAIPLGLADFLTWQSCQSVLATTCTIQLCTIMHNMPPRQKYHGYQAGGHVHVERVAKCLTVCMLDTALHNVYDFKPML